MPGRAGIALPASRAVSASPARACAPDGSSMDAWAPDRLLEAAGEWCKAAAARAREGSEWALQAGISAAQERVPVPRLRISRRSALRLRVCFLGFSVPPRQQQAPSRSCELILS